MANTPLKSLTFPGLTDTYVIPAWTDEAKEALLDCFAHVAWIDEHGQDYYDALEAALYPPADLVSISAVYTQSGTVYDTDTLDSLKSDLVVTATYEDSSTEVVTTYTLSGTLTAGTSTITVSYGGKTTTFTVTVTHQAGVYAVTNTLTGCTNSNSATSVTENDPYSATISASSGYTLTGATVSITMGGTDITSTAYSNGTITIASVTGALVISVAAVAVTLSSISAVYTQSGTVYDTDSLDSLKSDLVVTATYSDSSTATVTDYTLSGTLTVGSSTITVSYGGKTDTFTVTVSQATATPINDWDFTDSLVDSKGELTATVSGATQDANGINFTDVSQYVSLGSIYNRNRTYEIDITDWDMQGSANYNNRLIMIGSAANTGNGLLIFRHGYGWSSYISSWASDIYGNLTNRNEFANSTIKIQVDENGGITLYVDDVLIGTSSLTAPSGSTNMYIGTSGAANLGSIHNSKITGFRVYEGVV